MVLMSGTVSHVCATINFCLWLFGNWNLLEFFRIGIHLSASSFSFEVWFNSKNKRLNSSFLVSVVVEEPEFTEVIENVTVPAGRNVRLGCSVKNLGSFKVRMTVDCRMTDVPLGVCRCACTSISLQISSFRFIPKRNSLIYHRAVPSVHPSVHARSSHRIDDDNYYGMSIGRPL